MEYINYDIRIGPGPTYPIYAESQPVGEAEGVFSFDPNDARIRDALQKVAERRTDSIQMSEFGHLLFQHLFTGEVGVRFEQTTGFTLAHKEQGVRIRLRIAAPELAPLPWELLFNPARAFLGVDQRSPIVRWLYVPKPIQHLQAQLPLQVLVAVPDIVAPFPPLETNREIEALTRALAVMGEEVTLTVLKSDVTLDRIGHALIDAPCHVLHFIGHAEFKDNCGRLLLNRENGGMEWVDEHRFAGLLQHPADLKLVVLNACQGATVSGTQSFVGIAPKLVQAGVPAVIAMQYPIYDAAAVLFAREFYYALFKGANAGRVDWAVTHARNALIREFPDQREFATPVLFFRAPEGVLFYKVSGRRWRDMACSKRAIDTEKAAFATHRFNQSLAGNREAHQDRDFSKYLERDRRDYDWLKKRIAFRNRLFAVTTAAFVLAFTFFWVGLFDLLRLDTLLEGMTLSVGNMLKNKPLSENLAMVSVNGSVNPTMRKQYARLVERLSLAGARVVVFDMTFPPYEPEHANDDIALSTEAFGKAIKSARSRGTEVVLGFKSLDGGVPVIEDALGEALGPFGLGSVCLSGKLGYYGINPIAIQAPGAEKGGQGETYPSLALAAFFALNTVGSFSIDWQRKKIDLFPFPIGPVFFSEKRRAREGRCPANPPGSLDADLFIDLSPAGWMRDARRMFSFERIVSEEEGTLAPSAFSGKVVFVGVRTEGNEHVRVFDVKNDRRYGVELHADSFRTIQNSAAGVPVVRPLAAADQALMMVGLILVGVFIRFWIKPPAIRWRIAAMVSLPLLYAGVGFYLCITRCILIDWLYHLGGFFFAYWIAGRVERKWISQAFAE
ncbi:membrane hypothetical protein [Desulfosarcina cetonica]|uniref:CHAT domain-containing protein n=1 Tax=Desulfosarcina cetonica TaxID=90730 RepID=UPI0006D27CD0|nr:CHAT domain-containing protein [Desulfosarcina cetonica]VTR69297.1 membrane hypothetical protein [Desulfosarcina cetonica]